MDKNEIKVSWKLLTNLKKIVPQKIVQFEEDSTLKGMTFSGDRSEVKMDDLELLSKLNELCRLVVKYDSANIYNMDKNGLF